MQYDKTIKDTEGDTARVAADPTDLVVELWTRQEIGPGSVYLALAPDAARRLARALKQAANVAEGKPAKAPRKDAPPQGVISGSGIMFRRDPNGTYSTSGCIRSTCAYPRKHFDRSLSALLADGGRVMR